jgi:TPR repeat protein
MNKLLVLFLLIVSLIACSDKYAFKESVESIETTFNERKNFYDSQDYENAFSKWHSLAKLGDAESAFRIGEMYDFAEGVDQNYREAAKWYLVAAERGHGESQCKIADRYDAGLGIQHDHIKAYKWYWLCLHSKEAKASGTAFHYADSRLNSYLVVGLLSPNQIEYAESQARAWKPKPNLRSRKGIPQ